MRLELASFPVRDIRFGARTAYDEGVLWVDRDELRRQLMELGAFEDVGIEIARPGDAVRLIHVMDAVEPRCKPGGEPDFPGYVGPQGTVGRGRTHRLEGMAIISVGEAVAGEPTYWREAILEMRGPGAAATLFGSLVNLVLEFKPLPKYLDASATEANVGHTQIGSLLSQRYNRAVRTAELRAATYLARTTEGLSPARTEVYEQVDVDPALPRVLYLYQLNGVAIYGDESVITVPTLMHPNEVLDGALINFLSNTHAAYRYGTYFIQNHAVVQDLYARHGQDLNFAGVVLFPRGAMQVDKKEMLSDYVAKLVRMLDAQGAILSYTGGGHSAVDLMMVAKKCERDGVKTVLIMPEGYGTPDEPGFVYYEPEAVAITSTGRLTQTIHLEPAPAVIGGQAYFDLAHPPRNAQDVPFRYLFGACVSTGNGYLIAREY